VASCARSVSVSSFSLSFRKKVRDAMYEGGQSRTSAVGAGTTITSKSPRCIR
jgi:hypothetical protein